MTLVIKAENIAKKYVIGHRSSYKTLRDSFYSLLKRSDNAIKEDFWALKDVSFEINQGDKVGIIGRNGAGKSTLLKILSRITDPTAGRIGIKGRVASLLEVGTGFHSELTGRENIFLKASILGMTYKETKKKFDEIVEFSGVEKFLDTPVKRYSSGMYVRLAFAVAAHLDCEILLIDEILAVGDAEFQKKCLGKMNDISKFEGRTILFVSHNIGIVKDLCNRGLVINEGKILIDSDVEKAVSLYSQINSKSSDIDVDLTKHSGRKNTNIKILKRVYLKDSRGNLTNVFSQSDDIHIFIEYESNIDKQLAGIGFELYSIEGIKLSTINTYMCYQPPYKIPSKGTVEFIIYSKQLNTGTYYINISIGSDQYTLDDYIENAITFTISQSDIYGTGYLLTKQDGFFSIKFDSSFK